MNLSQLYSDICKSPLLSKEEESRLLDIIFSKDSSEKEVQDAKGTLVSSHRRFVFKRAKSLTKGDLEQFEEIYNAGCEGLIVGLDKFDHSKGMRFLTYAGWWVYQRQMKAMSEFRLVSLPTQKQQLSVKMRKYKDSLGREPTLEEYFAEFPTASPGDVNELSQTSFLTFYLNNVTESETPYMEGTETLEREMMTDKMYSVINSFNNTEADLIRRMYGLTSAGSRESYASIIESDPSLNRQYLKDLKEKALEVMKLEMS